MSLCHQVTLLAGRWNIVILQGKHWIYMAHDQSIGTALSLRRSSPHANFAKVSGFLPLRVFKQIPPSATTGSSHQDNLVEMFLRVWLPTEEAFPRTVNTKDANFLPTASGQEFCLRKSCVGKADFCMLHAIAQHNTVQ